MKCIFRKADKNDIRSVFNLSNEEEVRQNSINREKILWKNHVAWFNKKINDQNCEFFVVNDNLNDLVGQVRYDIVKNEAIVSISIAPKFRGKKLSVQILRESVKIFQNSRKNIDEILAYIRPENIISINLFKKCGFRFKDNTKIKNSNFMLYTFNRKGNNDF